MKHLLDYAVLAAQVQKKNGYSREHLKSYVILLFMSKRLVLLFRHSQGCKLHVGQLAFIKAAYTL